MATDLNITMKQYNGVDYDTLYPATKASQIIDTLPITSGGTNSSTASGAMNNLITPLSTITPANNDIIPLKDVSANAAVGATISQLISSLSSNGVITSSNLASQVANLGYAKIQTGSYVGTGTYGSGNPCSLTFDFVPELLFLTGAPSGNIQWFIGEYDVRLIAIGSPNLLPNEYTNGGLFSAHNKGASKMSNKTLSWYDTRDASNQINADGITYQYIAFAKGT